MFKEVSIASLFGIWILNADRGDLQINVVKLRDMI
jgi:hypothetical protein